jgi:GT2 family glycosyltransferase
LKELSIITINYNGLTDTCALIETIPFNDRLEVIVVDNASQNQEADTISKRFPEVKVIKSDQNLGFAGGNNLGIRAAQGKYLFFINNDTIFKEFNVQSLIDRLESSPDIAVVCPKIRFAWGSHPIQFTGYTPLSKITVRNQAIGIIKCSNHQNKWIIKPHSQPMSKLTNNNQINILRNRII